MAAQKRIGRELQDLQKNPVDGVKVELANEADMHKLNVTMDGPAGSPYSGGTFTLALTLPPEYPFKPPTVNFTTKIYHPNISNDSPGAMCLGMLKPDAWKPSTKIAAVLEFARQLLREPNPDDAVEGKIAEQFKTERGGWEREAREWTRRYAKRG